MILSVFGTPSDLLYEMVIFLMYIYSIKVNKLMQGFINIFFVEMEDFNFGCQQSIRGIGTSKIFVRFTKKNLRFFFYLFDLKIRMNHFL